MSRITKYIALVTLILFAASGIAALLDGSFSDTTTVPLSAIVAHINDRSAKEIVVEGHTLTVTLADKSVIVAKKESDASVSESLLALGADKDKLAKVAIEVRDPGGLAVILSSLLPTLIPLLIIIALFWFMFRQAQKGSMQAFSFGKTRARLANLDNEKKKITFKDVAGLVEAKEEVSEVVEFLKDPQRFHKLGARIPRGILLIGSPGTGKTLLAKAVANEAEVPFYYVSGSEFVEMFVGVGANRVRDTFDLAKKTAPSIVFIDEIDAVGRHRGAGLGGGHDEREQTLNQILVEMDGFDRHEAVIVMAATNRPDILDPALLRPGRFDRRVLLDEPSLKDRDAILRIHAQDKPFAPDVDFKKVAERTPGFSGADLANLVNEAAILAARKRQTHINQDNIFEAIEKVILGPERRSHAFSKKEKEITAYHEAGHALVAASLPHTDPVHKVSIVSRGRAGGYTLKLPTEDKHLKSRSEFESELAVLLGGYTAEQLKFKELTTGASNDLKVASDIARKMVTQYGMSEKLGPVTFGEKDELVFLGKEIGTERNYSEHIAQEIDREVSALLTRAFTTAKKVITQKLEHLERIAQALIEKETLEQKEFYALIGSA
ncbi:MAG: ATP-dependent zinc metalloprotease FtsH [Patescibacteria group bacterium]